MPDKKTIGCFGASFVFFVLFPFPLMALDKIRVGQSAISATSGSLWVADPRSFVDESIVREIDASGFIKELYEK